MTSAHNAVPPQHGSALNKKMLALVFSITVLVTMGISSVIPALPLFAKQFAIPIENTWRVIAAFALPGLVCIPIAGVWADRYGRKRVLVPALLIFAIGGLGCMTAQSFMELLLWRILQGMGSAPLGLLYSTIIADTWSGQQRVRAMSLNGMVMGLGTAASPAIGGALAMLDWRLPFILSALAFPVVWLACTVSLMRPHKNISLTAYSKAAFACVRNKQTLVLLALTLLTFIMLSGPIITCFPLLAHTLFQASSLQTGIVISAASLGSGLAASQLMRLYRLFSSRTLLLASMVCYIIGLCSIPFFTNLWWIILPILIFGFGQGMNIPLVSTLLTGQAPEEQRAALMASNAIILRLAQNIGPALFGTLAATIGVTYAIPLGSVLALAMTSLLLVYPLPAVDGENSSTAK